MRTDGSWTIYRLQVLTTSKDPEWVFSCNDNVGYPWVTGTSRDHLSSDGNPNNPKNDIRPGETCTHPYTTNGFSASGDCWQQTGIHGTFELQVGMEALQYMAKKFPERRWRLVKYECSRKTTPVATIRRKAA